MPDGPAKMTQATMAAFMVLKIQLCPRPEFKHHSSIAATKITTSPIILEKSLATTVPPRGLILRLILSLTMESFSI
jgi:hypothetical protein